MYKKFQVRQYRCWKIMIVTVFLASIITPFIAKASNLNEITWWQGIDTYHVDRANDNANDEDNRIKAVFFDRFFIGTFNNSYSRNSELIGYQIWHNLVQRPTWQAYYGVALALATGYDDELPLHLNGLITFGASPYAGLRKRLSDKAWLGFDMLYLPTDNGGVLVSGLNVTWRFKAPR